ncbi:hypothetical protein [Flavobacterium sp. 140616W15]|uniref:hypothetical protein n=1 Tax=Flavobacterium sp. 140616W15 TaxID=2478552 RepID=UPI000F0C48A7|nr:hypothetical protein [Flavobacterium sp. 140616W15]AYN04384.1 hypothetical protein EAG11_09455 [Flavobacterium sp. 140616W15]
MKEELNIIPFVSVGEIKFGMTKEEVFELMGEANDLINDLIMNEVRAYYDDFVLVFIRKRLVDFRFSSETNLENVKIFINNIDLVNTNNIINVLSSLSNSKPSEEVKGYINFYGLGICLGGFGKRKINSGKEIRVFSKGRLGYYKIFLEA